MTVPANAATPASRLRASWDRNAAAWVETVRGGGIESRRAVTDAAILRAVLRHAPRRVLDVGCGEGWLARALADRGIEVTGIDASPELIDAARRAGGGDFLVRSYEEVVVDPTCAGGEFDAAVCNFSLLGDPVSPLIGALRSVLPDDGVLIIQTAHPWEARGSEGYVDGWREETFDGFGGSFPASMPWYFRTLASWHAEITAGGLRIGRIDEPLHPDRGSPASLALTCFPLQHPAAP